MIDLVNVEGQIDVGFLLPPFAFIRSGCGFGKDITVVLKPPK